ncbi:hypothetical protein KP509_17G074800 [Ceratopteris richardii]|uniref:Pentatricopeptide repeat-containing protein n=1 Tax=Ceratopteris richardii TaxID=49495 RepID=A0A8T2SWV1_CERRI|nr:hypothetical protein KP509_17G074800 [Ceratopteris richardii]
MSAACQTCKDSHLFEKFQLLKNLYPVDYSSYLNLLVSLLQGCIVERNLYLARELHCLVIQQGLEANTFSGSYLIRLFSVCGSFFEAGLVFNKLRDPNVFAWSETISSQSNQGKDGLAIHLFNQMIVHAFVHPDSHVFVAALTACANAEALLKGREIHSHAIESCCESDLFLNNALINLYVKCGALDDARLVFGKAACRDAFSWSIIIAGYAKHFRCEEAILLFDAMHKEGIEANNVIWNTIIYGYVKNGDCHGALELFLRMLLYKRDPDNFTYVSVLNACSGLATIEQGRLIHADIVESGYLSDVHINSILIDMYAKCGTLADVHGVFDMNKSHNVVTWTAMMSAYALHNNYEMVLYYFKGMQRAGWVPNSITFLCLLSTCSHMGLVEDAFLHFSSMKEYYGITPTQEHYNCILDLLGRAGLFDEISEILGSMKDTLNCVAWTSLLHSCKVFSQMDLGGDCLDYVANVKSRDDYSFSEGLTFGESIYKMN